MAYNDEHIFQLILEKLSGEISDENRLYLEQAAREDDNIRRCLEEMEEASDVVGPDFMNDVYSEMAWSNVLSLLDSEQPNTKIVTVSGEDASDSSEKEEKKTPVNTEKKTPEKKKPVNTGLSGDKTGTPVGPSGSSTIDPQHTIDPKGSTTLRTWLVAATALVILSSLVYFFISGTGKQPVPIAKNKIVIPTSGGIQLLLDNGKTIPLPGSEGNVFSMADLAEKAFTDKDLADKNHTDNALTDKAGSKEGWATLLIPTGKDYKVILADGSAVQLNAYSSLRFNFSEKIREVFLSGEAYFTIAQKAAAPFIVHSGATVVKVLGTSFNINAYSDSLIITSLVEGSILSSNDEEPEIQLQPGTEAIYRKGYLRQIHSFDENITLAWRKGQYNYYNESLGMLETVILHWYGKQLLFKDSAMAAKKLTGIIERDKPLTDFLDGLGKTSGLAYEVNGDKIYLTEK